MKSLFVAATGMDAQQTRIAVISNNLANITTTGFKAGRAIFEDLLYETVNEPGAESSTGVTRPAGLQIGSGAKIVSTPSIFNQGVLEQTGREFDVAIEGNGFFQVQLPNSEIGYSRGGALAVNADGELVTQAGDTILPSVSGLTGVTNLEIGVDGTVSGIPQGQTDVTQLGTINVFIFPNPAGLKSIGRSTYLSNAASGESQQVTPGTQGSGTLRQGFLEGSNVNVAEELIRMVLAQRAFEMNSKVVRTSDEMMNAMNQMR
ncbi:MAG: flagellar basal-body rod protein FlgG [Deltaproteobacteria bacterium CG11_big_fil_rev_8_21_14_0_20_45_16]|nr:MAG: flagellar basal-body rod protein FlgG [Deltaproteobacteria bacterium CG11_big_fil_rev_8_21_14_0_20_45_16]